ncbi:hypothetical protein [Sphingomonas sp. TDK1]|uniref:hypothetical protein n=1 Tax=Sphingomonas sp. TDK1 TaxID=453247 RepID=UPI0007D9F547|nr:hypothetical protein [Sphingomonas sp. TDK1]OAN65713.1 hypothetical protein A7X12_15480 [Sphingomonas sp. TDK1]
MIRSMPLLVLIILALAVPPADSLFVGCNYVIASEADFLDAARGASGMVADAGRDIAGLTAVIVPPQ